jgi:hypothetical protein
MSTIKKIKKNQGNYQQGRREHQIRRKRKANHDVAARSTQFTYHKNKILKNEPKKMTRR